jgi:hypothetical protein
VADPTVDVFDVIQYYSQRQFLEKQMRESKWFAVIASNGVYDINGTYFWLEHYAFFVLVMIY